MVVFALRATGGVRDGGREGRGGGAVDWVTGKGFYVKMGKLIL